MRLVNVFITSDYVCIYSPDSPSILAFQELINQTDFVDPLSELLSDSPLAKGTTVNFIVDQRYAYYFYLSFPLINRRKIDNMLLYELEDSLIDDPDTYHLDYYLRKRKEDTTTELGIYVIPKTTLNKLQLLCKEHHLEIKWVSSFNNLLDLKFREEIDPKDHIYVSFDRKIAHIFIYNDGFLTGNTHLILDNSENHQKSGSISEELLKKINQKIASIRIEDDRSYNIAVDRTFSSEVKQIDGDQIGIEDIKPTNDNIEPVELKELLKPSILNHPYRVNLSNTDLLLFQELKKQIRGLSLAAAIIFVCLVLYGSSVGYSIYQNSGRMKQLTFQYEQTVKQLLPKGASKSNAVAILKDQVEKLKQNRNKNLRFSKREYFISSFLAELSSLKEVISSFHLNRFSYNKRVIRFHGTVTSISEMEELKEQLESLYPKSSHNIKLNQRSIGNESVELSISIHFLSNG